MNLENTHALMAIYPALFSCISHDEPFALFGFECGDGWFEILKELIEGIKQVCDREKIYVKVEQVKEKFGQLRFYASGIRDDIRELIEIAEYKSGKTCEMCGKPAESKSERGWWFTLCDKCHK